MFTFYAFYCSFLSIPNRYHTYVLCVLSGTFVVKGLYTWASWLGRVFNPDYDTYLHKQYELPCEANLDRHSCIQAITAHSVRHLSWPS
jgi:hypothetical protein